MAANPMSYLSLAASGLVEHLRSPLFRNGYALTISAMGAAALGLVYWAVAARLYPTEAVGTNAGAISAMLLLANVSMLSLMNALVRFIPTAGQSAGRVVFYSYLVSGSLAALAALVFVLGTPIWAPSLGFLRSYHFGAWFVLSTAAWTIFVLQDSVLAGLRRAVWVPVENLAYAVVKLVALGALAATLPLYGVLVSWTLPVVFVNLTVNWFIFRKLIVRRTRPEFAPSTPVTLGAVVRYVRADSMGVMVWQATIHLLPVIVLERQGAEAAAVFYIAVTVGYAVQLMADQMGMSLMAEGSANPHRLEEYGRKLLLQLARLLVPVVLVMLIGAPLVLRVFGEMVAQEGATLVRLLALDALPAMVISVYLYMARVRGRLRELVLLYITLSVGVLSLAWFLLEPLGIAGVGMAWLVTEGVVAAVLLATRMRFLWRPGPARASARG